MKSADRSNPVTLSKMMDQTCLIFAFTGASRSCRSPISLSKWAKFPCNVACCICIVPICALPCCIPWCICSNCCTSSPLPADCWSSCSCKRVYSLLSRSETRAKRSITRSTSSGTASTRSVRFTSWHVLRFHMMAVTCSCTSPSTSVHGYVCWLGAPSGGASDLARDLSNSVHSAVIPPSRFMACYSTVTRHNIEMSFHSIRW